MDLDNQLRALKQTWHCHWASDPCSGSGSSPILIKNQPTALRAAEVFAVMDHFGSAGGMIDELTGGGRVCVHSFWGGKVLVDVSYRVGDPSTSRGSVVSLSGYPITSKGQLPFWPGGNIRGRED